MIRQDKIVVFGAGKIGRSFIGQLFSRGGYEVVFVDIDKNLIAELNRRNCYRVIIKSEREEILIIKNVRGVLADDEELVSRETATAAIVAVSVGQRGLDRLMPVLAKGMLERYQLDKEAALDIIIAENMRNSCDFFRDRLSAMLPAWYPMELLTGLIETSIGKMVPIMRKKDLEEDPLQVFAEPYNTLILDRKGFRNPVPPVEGLCTKDNMKAWVDRKFFIHNLGHAAAAYLGHLYNPGFVLIHEALSVPEVHDEVRDTMLQSAGILIKKYPGEFTPEDLVEHTDDLLKRFINKALGDTIYRIGSDLMRKLGPEDRLAGPIRAAIELNMPYDKILKALVYGFHFRATDEEGNILPRDKEFNRLFNQGPEQLLTQVCGFDPDGYSNLHKEVLEIEKSLVFSDYF